MSLAVGTSVPILLLKTKSTPIDGYEDYFSNKQNGHYRPAFVSVLKHTLKESAVKQLVQLITSGSFLSPTAPKIYGGLIFTSQRAVEAFAQAIKDVEATENDCRRFFAPDLPLFAVGPATARMLRALQLPCPVLGEESGNGEALARFILGYKRETSKSDNGESEPLQQDTVTRDIVPNRPRLPLLFLVGEQRRDIIPKMLQDASLPTEEQITVEELTVYESVANPNLKETFTDTYNQIHSLPQCNEAVANERHERRQQSVETIWVVFFSPTGCGAVLEALSLLDGGMINQLSSNTPGATPATTNMRTAAIGPTTRDYLVREYNFQPDIVAERPSPEGLGRSIRYWQENH